MRRPAGLCVQADGRRTVLRGVTDTAHTQDTISKPIRNRLASLIEGSQRGRCEEDMERSARVISPQSFGYIIEHMMEFFSARAAATARCLS